MASDLSKLCFAFNVKHIKTDFTIIAASYPTGIASEFLHFVNVSFQSLFADRFIEFAVKMYVCINIIDTCYIYLL